MKPVAARAIAYTGVALLALGALNARPPRLPDVKPAQQVLTAPPTREPVWVSRADTLGRGESLAELFERTGAPAAELMAVLAETPSFDDRRVPAGLAVATRALDTDSVPSEIVLHFGVDRLVRLTRSDSGWTGAEERLPWTSDTAVVAGRITSTLYGALDSAAADVLPARLRAELAWALADILEYRVDMSRDLKQGDAVQVLFERSTTPTGAVRLGRVLAVSMLLSGDSLQAFRFGDGDGRFYDQDGKSLRAMFLRAPLEFRRISSVFGMRKHPILGTWRAHRGTDYAAGSGTPVRSVGDGVVVFAGRKSGYGNVVDVRHTNGYVSRYAHLRGFAKGVRRGTRVGISETIGYVGMTGLATAPHLHFEVLVGGVQRDPRKALASRTGAPLDAGQRAAFARHRAGMLAAMETARPDAGSHVRLASARP